MPRPICVKCRVEMRCRKNDFPVRDPAVDDFPSTYWLGDMYECPGCKARIVTGFGKKLEGLAARNYADWADAILEFRYELPAVPGSPEGGAR